jgi:regulator of sirC expression with transglutaminase-like and TPR domain
LKGAFVDAEPDLFDCRSLAELVKRRGVQVEHAAIWIARDAHPQLSPAQVLLDLDTLAENFDADALDTPDAHEQATALVHHVAMRHGFQGNRANYNEVDNSYLDSVLRRKTGIPISLAVVYMAVAHRVGIPVLPIGFPGHFLVRVGAPSGVLVDPFDGRLITSHELPALLTQTVGPQSTMKPEYLAPVGVADVAQRMLLNLKRLHETQQDFSHALLVTDRLVELTGSPEFRRDRGMLALKLGANQVASTDLAHYLLKRPNAGDAAEVRNALARSRKAAPLMN